MKLSKQERIAAIVVVVLVIIVAGVFLLIKPRIEKIFETKATLESKEREYKEAVNKAEQMEPLKAEILEAYNKGKNMADRFYPELPSYEADKKFREFLSKAQTKANVLVEDLQVSEPTTATLSSYVYVPAGVQYALKYYVNQGTDTTLDPRLIRQAALQLILGEAQTIGATTVTFTVQAVTLEDLLKFADAVNDYNVSENGNTVRKAIEIDNVTFTDVMTHSLYAGKAMSLIAEAEPEAAKQFLENTGYKVVASGYDGEEDNNNSATPSTPSTGNEGEGSGDTPPVVVPGSDPDEDGVPLDYYHIKMPCTITFYSIEGMQDPAATLNEQDKLVNEAS